VGFGDGRFTALRAQAAPDDDFVGLEVSGTSVLRALRRMRRDGIRNVRLLKAPAEIAVRQLFAPAALSSITVNFPDPWPKERHEHHRLLRAPFFRLAATSSRRGARSGWRPTTCPTSTSRAPRPRPRAWRCRSRGRRRPRSSRRSTR
jgi:tRNA (guanine-N7-)-methyltransferase